jgi:hypothetical protein
MPTTIRATGPDQFLGLLPSLLGYVPTQSVVLVPFVAQRSVGAMRFDLPDPGEHAGGIATTMIGTLCRLDGVNATMIVVYTDGDHEAYAPLCLALERAAEQCGLALLDVLYVSPAGYGSLLNNTEPTSMDTVSTPPEAPAYRAGDQSGGAVLPDVDVDTRREFAEALPELDAAVAALTGEERGKVNPYAAAAVVMLDDVPELFENALGWDTAQLDVWSGSALVFCLRRPALRDIGLVTWTTGRDTGDEALDAQLRWESGEEYPAHLAMHMWGEGPRPDPTRLEAALGMCRYLAAAVPDQDKPGPLAAAGWLAWALGRSTEAEVHANQAREIEPEHGLAEIVLSFVTAGHLPDWAFRNDARA